MRYLKKGKLVIPFIIIVLAICSEWLPELFSSIPFRFQVPDNNGYVFDTTYRDAVWYFIYSLFIEIAMFIIFLQINKTNIAGKLLMLAPVTWFLIELFEKLCFLLKINDSRLYFNDGSRWQIFLTLFFLCSAIYGLSKYKF